MGVRCDLHGSATKDVFDGVVATKPVVARLWDGRKSIYIFCVSSSGTYQWTSRETEQQADTHSTTDLPTTCTCPPRPGD